MEEGAVKSQMANTLHLILLISGFGLISCFEITRKYHHITPELNWADAQHYCRTKYTDLAIIESMDDVKRMIRPENTSHMWIGLYHDPQPWKWSSLGESLTPTYQNWGSSQPNYNGRAKICARTQADGTWNDDMCYKKYNFVCYQDMNPGQKTYIPIENASTWEDAQTYCRTHYTDLAMIENQQENSQVQSVKSSDIVWIGLSRSQWRWSDNSNSSFRHWRINQPDNHHGDEYCVVDDPERFWHDDSCGTKRPFWCYEVTTVKRMVKMKFRSHADLSDPAVNDQLLQQIRKMLEKQGCTDFKLHWKTPPRKQKEKEEDSDV